MRPKPEPANPENKMKTKIAWICGKSALDSLSHSAICRLRTEITGGAGSFLRASARQEYRNEQNRTKRKEQSENIESFN